jgi:hypothetical protein
MGLISNELVQILFDGGIMRRVFIFIIATVMTATISFAAEGNTKPKKKKPNNAEKHKKQSDTISGFSSIKFNESYDYVKENLSKILPNNKIVEQGDSSGKLIIVPDYEFANYKYNLLFWFNETDHFESFEFRTEYKKLSYNVYENNQLNYRVLNEATSALVTVFLKRYGMPEFASDQNYYSLYDEATNKAFAPITKWIRNDNRLIVSYINYGQFMRPSVVLQAKFVQKDYKRDDLENIEQKISSIQSYNRSQLEKEKNKNRNINNSTTRF